MSDIVAKTRNKPRILIFSLVYYPRFIGGAEVAIKEITDRLGARYDFDMITLRLDRSLPSQERIGNVNVYRVGWTSKHSPGADSLPWYLHVNKYLLPFTALWKAFSLSNNIRYDGIWTMMATYNSFAALLYHFVYPKIPFILTLQEGDPIPYIKRRARIVWPFFKMIFTRATTIQTISNYLADFARDMGARCPIEVIPNAVDMAHFSRNISDEELNMLRNHLGKKADDIYLITTSRLVIKNGVGDIISSLAHLPAHIRLLILGTGYLERELREKAQRLGVSDRVVFLGYIPHSEMPKYLRISDIFVRPSLSEGFGNSFIEAMAAGLPVIATPVGGIVDFIEDGQTGLFANVNDPESIAEQVLLIMHDAKLHKKLIIRGFTMVKEHYDWSLISRNMQDRVFGQVVRAE